MKNSKLLFVAAFTLVAIVFALFEYDVLPNHAIGNDPATNYVINLAAIATGIGGCFVLLYWFRLPIVRKNLEAYGTEAPWTEEAEQAYARHCNARLIIWTIITLFNVVLYYEASYAKNPIYCVIILCIAGIFCWPAMPASPKK